MLKKHILIIFLIFLVVFKSQSQSQTENYPVSATLVFAAPFSLKVSDYFTSNTRMYLNLNLKDLTKPTLKVYLKWSLEGPGIHIATRDGFIPTSFIELSKGTVSLQRGSDLSLYFQRGMLDYQGIDEGVVFNGSIPEGFYTMKFQALEAGSGREVSNLAESFFFVTSPQPPIINQPFNGSIVPVTNPQNVLLQWTPRQISTLESQVVYEVKVYEVAEGDDPVVVANSGIVPKFKTTVSTTSTLMGASDLPLEEGKRYAMVVTAIDLNKKMSFVNDGRSEVSWFQYGQGCFAPSGLDVAEIAPGRVVLSWTPNTTAEGYVIEYKKKAETTWIVNGSLDNSYTINGLSPQTDYEFRVKTQCSGGKYSAYTATESVSVIGLVTPTPETEVSLDDVLDPFSQIVSTKKDGTPFDPKNIDELFALLKPPACAISGVSYVCGQTPNATPPVGEELTTLAKGDVLGIYDYAVLVTEVSKGSSPFTGKGLVKLPFAGGIKVPVEFKGIKAKKGEDGTHGGCVWYVPSDLNEGYFQVKGSQQDAIVKEQEKLLADIYSELIDPQSFYGTFEEALAKYEAKRKEIQVIEDAGGKARKEDYQELTKNLRGIVQGGKDWKEKLLKHFGSDANKPENKAILEKLDALKAALLACEKCVADNLSTTPPKTGGGGPMGFEDWEVNLAKCVYPDAQKEMGDIKISIANNACGPESILACVGAAAMDIALNYAFKWVEVNFLDENKQNNYAITDFDNIWKAQDKYEVFSSAATACAVALVPFPTGTTKEKILATAVGAFAGGAVALITDAGDQYEVLPESMSVGDKLSSIDWKQSFRKAGTSAFITGISSGIALWAIDHPRFKDFGVKVKSIGYDKIKALLKKSELSEETIEAFCRRFGIGKIGSRVIRTLAEIAPNGFIPTNSQTNNQFHVWFDNLLGEELDLVLGNPQLKKMLENRIRYPGGLHEWCMVCEIKKFKLWAVSMSEIHRFRTRTLDLTGINPITGEIFTHGGPGSTAFHNELQALIQTSNSLNDFNNRLTQLVIRWNINPNLLPPLIQ